ncbi:putative DNA binding domain-containing protein [Candidatus Synechococcus calcipolaris G9]|uniref:DNA binding domain-containing protein n=1 Tax=Candidatus Synechococcus calcipolaris G9 TaxID=1497997 RepID=A0ABT6EVU2_9SYNE|nr:ATP-binding protein [Candidatus Synechococcus calcipolaris]MDG2989391.1 putative DNA binding domain-containing protein [Candidatus Synechococcus calcipolaris G9]
MSEENLCFLLESLVSLPHETEWVEFKVNNADPEDIGQYLSALSNSAALQEKQTGYIVWGVEDTTHNILGTSFKPKSAKVGSQELENWLATQLEPRINFKICQFQCNGNNIVLFEIPRATYIPVKFKSIEYVRVGSYKKKLGEHPEKERQLWSIFSKYPFEKGISVENIREQDIPDYIDYPKYFELTSLKLPTDLSGILQRLEAEKLIVSKPGSSYDITNLGAILFAKNLSVFERLSRKAVRVIMYQGKNRIKTLREMQGHMGYAAGFEGLVSYINNLLPQNEVINEALRAETRMYPEIAIRELVANAIIHQNFDIGGTGPIVEIFSDRIEITNPGTPLIEPIRFIDQPPLSRNETLAAFMRRINVCEERGSGIDKVIHAVEMFQLPAPSFKVTDNHIQAILFAHKKLSDMDKDDKVRACYQHACLKFVSNEQMTNSSLRQRFSIASNNASIASRIISDTVVAGFIKPYDPSSESKKHAKYVPFWV